MKRISILGASGSIGTQAIDIIEHNPQLFEIVAFSVGENTEYAHQLLTKFKTIRMISVKNEKDVAQFENYDGIEIKFGVDGLVDVATYNTADIVLTAVSGAIGLVPTIKAIEAKKDIALANKETLVVAGHLVMPLVKEHGVQLLPVDSEHCAIFQCLQGVANPDLKSIILTASGGSFRDKTRAELQSVTKAQALNHPNWSMGAKITIDSATMFNKGLEVIEAHHLFNVDYDDIKVAIHPQSIIHSMIELQDDGILAQLGSPDMRLPIQFALTYPNHIPIVNSKRLDFDTLINIELKPADLERFPALKIAFDAGRIGGSMPCVMNAANEVAVELFLNEKINFVDIEHIVQSAIDKHQVIDNPDLPTILAIDNEIRQQIYKEFDE